MDTARTGLGGQQDKLELAWRIAAERVQAETEEAKAKAIVDGYVQAAIARAGRISPEEEPREDIAGPSEQEKGGHGYRRRFKKKKRNLPAAMRAGQSVARLRYSLCT